MLKINPVGRLGNDLYQYSACRSISQKLGYNFYVDFSGRGLNYHFGGDGKVKQIMNVFNLDVGKEDGDIKWNYYECKEGRTIITGPEPINIKSYSDDFGLVGIENNINSVLNKISDFTLLNGFFPNSFYFKDYTDVLLNWFKFKDEDYTILSRFNPDDYCYIHFRGEDFSTLFKDDEKYLTQLYYKNAINYFDIKKFVIFTNDIRLAKDEFNWMEIENIEYHIVNNSIQCDFFSMTRSKYYIGSYSSFSEWAGYLNINRNNGFYLFPFNIKGDISSQFYKFKYFNYLTRKNNFELL